MTGPFSLDQAQSELLRVRQMLIEECRAALHVISCIGILIGLYAEQALTASIFGGWRSRTSLLLLSMLLNSILRYHLKRSAMVGSIGKPCVKCFVAVAVCVPWHLYSPFQNLLKPVRIGHDKVLDIVLFRSSHSKKRIR